MIHIKGTLILGLSLLSISAFAGRFVVTPDEEYDTENVRKISFEQDKLHVTLDDGQLRSYDFTSFHRIYFTEKEASELNPVGAAELYLYPNPVSDNLYLRGVSAGASYEMYDARGEKVGEGVALGEEIHFPVANFDRGIYFLKVDAKVLKFIKK